MILYAPSSKTMDITKSIHVLKAMRSIQPDIVIHAAAYTDLPAAEKNHSKVINTNVIGTKILCRFAKVFKSKMVYISSDYAQKPTCFYAWSKLAGESYVLASLRQGMVIRTSFKDRGTWGEDALTKVFHPVYTNADWTPIIAKKILEAVKNFKPGIVNIGTERKTLYDLAIQDYPEVDKLPVEQADAIVGYEYPRDCSMKLTK